MSSIAVRHSLHPQKEQKTISSTMMGRARHQASHRRLLQGRNLRHRQGTYRRSSVQAEPPSLSWGTAYLHEGVLIYHLPAMSAATANQSDCFPSFVSPFPLPSHRRARLPCDAGSCYARGGDK